MPKEQFEEDMAQDGTIVTLTEAWLYQLLEKAVLEKYPRELQLSTILNQKIGRSPFSYDIPNKKPGKGFKYPNLLKYVPVVCDPYPHLQEFESKLVFYYDGVLYVNYSLPPYKDRQ